MEFDGFLKGAKKPRTISLRRPRTAVSDAPFLNGGYPYSSSSPSDSPPGSGSANENGRLGLDDKMNYRNTGLDERVEEIRGFYGNGERGAGRLGEHERTTKRLKVVQRGSGHHDTEVGDKERRMYGETFKRKRHSEETDTSSRGEKHGHYKERERNFENHAIGRGLDGQVNSRGGEGGYVHKKLNLSKSTDKETKSAGGHSNSTRDEASVENRSTKVRFKVSVPGSQPQHGGSKSKQGETSSSHAKPAQRRLILSPDEDDEDDYAPRMEKPIQESTSEFRVSTAASAHFDYRNVNENQHTDLANDVLPKPEKKMGTQSVRKSSRTPKPRMFDGGQEEDIEENESNRKRGSKKNTFNHDYSELDEDLASTRKISLVGNNSILNAEYADEEGAEQNKRSWKKARYDKEGGDFYEEDEEEAASVDDVEDMDVDFEGKKSNKKETQLTARQRAMREADSELGANLIEFPNGLPLKSQRKKKEKLSDLEQQLKKAEAAQKRKIQVEKQNKEVQAEAIKKILGQDAGKKKREAKARKKRDGAQDKADDSKTVPSNSVTVVMNLKGTVLSFSEDVGMPSIFHGGPSKYPPEREKCAGPSCNNTYKYRDSKSNLPLCSIQCYRAINGNALSVSTC